MMSLWDENNVRYQLISTQGNCSKSFNWLFFPGGPGIDSSYFSTLTNHLTLPGNVWYIDFPNNGSNVIKEKDIQNFDAWLEMFMPIIAKFKNPIYVGHSFSAMLPLLYPELEEKLSGLVLLSSAPCLWFEASAQRAKQKGLPDVSGVLTEYMQNPNQETFWKANEAFAHYYFTPKFFQEGWALLEKTPVNPYGPFWWMPKVQTLNYSAKWIPQKVPTLIIGGAEDAVTPFSLFQHDERFHRSNIALHEISNVAHFPWMGALEEVKNLFSVFIRNVL